MLDNVVWVASTDMSNFPLMCKNRMATLEELELMIKMIVQNCASRLNISKEKLIPMIKEKNEEFFKLKEELFTPSTSSKNVEKNSKELSLLCSSFIIPINKERKINMDEIRGLNVQAGQTDSEIVNKLIHEVSSLTDKQKLLFISELKSLSITLTASDVITFFA